MIELGLARVSRLLNKTPFKWKAIHVAGTNGKGSVCAYASAMIHAAGVRCGRFTSPHLLDRWDGIVVGEKAVPSDIFTDVEASMKAKSTREKIYASEFEILTATAFQIFHQQRIDVGVIEVGLGGRYDATNVIPSPVVTVITKIGHDHEAYLGNGLEDIAHHKAGIIKSNALCIVDGTNHPSVLSVLSSCAQQSRARSIIYVPKQARSEEMQEVERALSNDHYAPHQVLNAQLALQAARAILRDLSIEVPPADLLRGIKNTSWPGRLQRIKLEVVSGSGSTILLDGAHNTQAARMLGSFVDQSWRIANSHVTWLIALTEGKSSREILGAILRPGDAIVAVAFSNVEGMPWVHAMQPETIVEQARSICSLHHSLSDRSSVRSALQKAYEIADGGPMVITGSLYLSADVLRLQRQSRCSETSELKSN